MPPSLNLQRRHGPCAGAPQFFVDAGQRRPPSTPRLPASSVRQDPEARTPARAVHTPAGHQGKSAAWLLQLVSGLHRIRGTPSCGLLAIAPWKTNGGVVHRDTGSRDLGATV